MKVAVTGAGGFLGSHTLAALRQRGHEVRGLARTEDEEERIRPLVDERIVGDQTDPRVTARLVAGADAVVHAAIDWTALGEGLVPNAERNLLVTLRLLDQAREAGVRQFLFVSSLEVYPHAADGHPLDENHLGWPATIYGAMKGSIELHLKAFHAVHGLNVSAWRPATMFGIHPEISRSHWFDLVRRVKRGEPFTAQGSEEIVWVRDVAETLALAVGVDSVAGEIYNLADLQVDLPTVARMARELSGSKAPVADAAPPARLGVAREKALAFLDARGHDRTLRRGLDCARRYVAELLRRV